MHTLETLLQTAELFAHTWGMANRYDNKYGDLDAREKYRAALQSALTEVLAERDALANDAARYRWLRDQTADPNSTWSICDIEGTAEYESGGVSDADAAIDLAMKGTP